MNKIALLSIIVFTLISPVIRAQEKLIKNSCLKALQECNKNMNLGIERNKDNGVYIRYRLIIGAPESFGGDTTASSVELYRKGDQAFFFNDGVEIFQDANTSVRVLPAKRQISIYNYFPSEINNYNLERYKVLNDSLFDMARVAHCGIVMKDGVALQLIRLQFNEQWVKKFGVRFANITFDESADRIHEFELFYTSGRKYQYMKVVVEDISFGENSRLSASNPLSMIYDGKTLRDKYKGYAVTDKRTSNKIK